MTQYTATGTAALMLTAADRYQADGAHTGRRAAELALPATHTSDVHVASSGHGDPTFEQATSERPAIATYETRWRVCTTALRGWVGDPLTDALRAASPKVARSEGVWGNSYLINRLGHQCDELIKLIDLCKPMDLEQARKALDDEQRKAIEASYCLVCECPMKPGESRGGKCDADRKLQQRWIDTGRVEGSDEAAFKQAVIDDIARGTLTRPASPYQPVGRVWVPEEAV